MGITVSTTTTNTEAEAPELPKLFFVRSVANYGGLTKLSDAIKLAQEEALVDREDQYVMKAVKIVRGPKAEYYCITEDVG